MIDRTVPGLTDNLAVYQHRQRRALLGRPEWKVQGVRVYSCWGRRTPTASPAQAFAAGVILGLHEGWPVERCLRLGVASAAASVRSPNTSDGIAPAEACLAEAERAGYRLIG